MMSNRLFRVMIVIALGILATFTIREAVATSTVAQSNPDTVVAQDMQRSLRSRDADAARWNAAAEYYRNQNQAVEKIQVYWAAEAARWNAMAEHYLKIHELESGRSQRSLDAETARWIAITKYYSGR